MLPWFLLVGAVLIVMALSGRWVQQLPLSPAIVYLGVGWLIGPAGTGLLPIDPIAHAPLLEVLTEVAVLITLFAVALRLKLPLRAPGWRVPVRLAGIGMVIMTVLGALAAHWLLGLPPAGALLLAAVLAPTDPVLASDVQIVEPGDRDAVRLSLTAEGGLNDGTAFPAVMLALGLLGTHEIGEWGWRWIALDLVWAVGVGLALGWACGLGIGHAMTRMRRAGVAPVQEEFLVFGVIALTYGLALLLRGYGFVAVFAAGCALAHVELRHRDAGAAPEDDASHPVRLLRFAGQCESLAEVVVVLLIGALLGTVDWDWMLVAYGAVLLLVVRPLMVVALAPGLGPAQRRLIAWFGIRGVGTVYYLMFAIRHGVPGDIATIVVGATLVTIALSIVAHGMSATPLMERYRRMRGSRPP